jgi:F-type H+-transporting ATPase subunit b
MVAETTNLAVAAVETAHVAESTGALAALGIDLKLFLAQLLNFAVVLFVMWKWVYRPLLKTMDARTAKLEQGLKDAEAAGSAKEEAQAERDKAITAARMEAKKIIEEAAAMAETERASAVARTKAEVERVVMTGKERLATEQAAMLADVRAQAAELVTMVAEKVLAEKMDSASDKKFIDSTLKQL